EQRARLCGVGAGPARAGRMTREVRFKGRAALLQPLRGQRSPRVIASFAMARRRPLEPPGPLHLEASILGEHLHLTCLDWDAAATVVDYSTEDGWLKVECLSCSRAGRLKLAHHSIWRAEGHGITDKEERERTAAHIHKKLKDRKPGERPDWTA